MSDLVASLDAALADKELITLRRVVGAGNSQVNVDLDDVPAAVEDIEPAELVEGAGPAQQRQKVIISPTQIAAAQWPGGVSPEYLGDPRLPVRGDKVVIRGADRNVEFVKAFIEGGELVRIELTVA